MAGGRIVSEATLTSRINSARIAVGGNGHDQWLIRTVLRRGIRFVGTVREEATAEAAVLERVAADRPTMALPLPDRPSIAVSPFGNISGEADQDYFADGIVEESLPQAMCWQDT